MSFVLKTALPIIAHGPLQTLLDATKSPEEVQSKLLFDYSSPKSRLPLWS